MLPKIIALVVSAGSVSCSALKSTAEAFKAVPTAGAHVSAVFPPPNAANTGKAVDALFPTNVGFAGPTPTGDEAEELASATQAPIYANVYPLLNPPSPKGGPSSFNIMRHWGSLTPWYSIDSLGLPKTNQLIPDGCDIVQVHLIHRHGARYPTSGSSTSSFANKLQKAVKAGTGFTASGDLAFLNDWTYKLGAELLTPFGRQQMFELGVAFRMKYGHLLKNFTDLPVFRTTSEDRMVKSAVNFATGFFGVPEYLTDYHQLITIEDDNINNTLAGWQNCPNAENQIYDFGEDQSDKWFDSYLQSTVTRLQKFIQGVNLTTDDAYAMQSLCAYETVALGSSQFCSVFTKEEWEGYEYYSDVDFWYSEGPGNPATAAQGIGYVQEFLARLTQTPISVHNSSTNSTLDNNPLTFPLNQPIYVDATHDSMFPPLLVAFNFTTFAAGGPLPLDRIPNDQTFIVSQIAPFGTNLVSQVLSCPSRVHGKSTGAPLPNDATHVRFLLNDAAIPLTGIRGCTADSDGLCPLPTFVEAMKQRIKEVDFAFDCFANYSTPSLPDTIVDGRPPWSIRPKS